MSGDWQPPTDPRDNDSPWPSMVWPPVPDATLTGSVVRLTQQTDGDAAPLFEALSDERVWRHLTYRHRTVVEFAEWLNGMRKTSRIVWVVRLNTDQAGRRADDVVGMSSYLNISPHDARLEIGGTAYAPAVWGTNVNAETKFLLLRYAFEHLGVGRVQFVTDIRNVRSQHALAGIGASYEGILRRYQRRADGTVRDSVLFSVTVEDWPRVRDGLQRRLRQ